MKNHLIKLSLFIIPFMLLQFYFDIDFLQIKDLNEALTGAIAFSSSSLGFFIAGVSILQTSNLSKYYQRLVQLGTDKKIISWLMAAIGYMFLLSSLSLILLIFKANPTVFNLLLNIWAALLCASVFSMLFIIVIFYSVFTK